MRHLSRVIEHEQYNKMSKEVIFSLWAPIFYPLAQTNVRTNHHVAAAVELIFNLFSCPIVNLTTSMTGSISSNLSGRSLGDSTPDLANKVGFVNPLKRAKQRHKFSKSVYDNLSLSDVSLRGDEKNEAVILEKS